MSGYHIALGVAALVALALSYKTPRAWMWIGALAASFVVSVAYLNVYEAIEAQNLFAVYSAAEEFVPLEVEWLPPSVIAAITDALVCFAILAFGRERWETVGLFGLTLGMLAINLMYATGTIFGFPPIPSQNFLGVSLEVINYAALLLIGGTGIMDLARHGNGGARSALDHFLGIGRAFLHAPAKRHPFWTHR